MCSYCHHSRVAPDPRDSAPPRRGRPRPGDAAAPGPRARRVRITLITLITLLAAVGLAGPAAGCGEKRDRPRQTTDRGARQASVSAAKPSAADWCAGHRLPESKCTQCNPALVAKFKKAGDWCAAHGFPESVCPHCNPVTPPSAGHAKTDGREKAKDPAKTDGHGHGHGHGSKDWCVGHGLPESKCTQCNPALVAKFKNAGDWCVTHGYPASVCPECNPVSPPPGTRPPPLFPPGTRIRFRTPSIERDAGLAWVPATKARLSRRVHTTARIDYDRDRLAEIRSPVPALVQRVRVELGARVSKGAKLLTLSSARIGVLKSRLVAAARRHRVAKANLKRQQALHRSGGASTREVELARLRLAEAASGLAATHQSLQVGGISAGGSAGTFTLLSPIAGTVVKRPAVLGAQAGPGTSLAVVADTRTMWALLDVSEWDAARVRPGQPVRLQVAGLSGRPVSGRITWVSTEVDPRTRYVQARARVDNPEGRLRANQFARATIEVKAPRGEVTVPRAAVQQLGNGHVVFVRKEPGLFEPRQVAPGRSEGEQIHVKGALRPGEAVVTTGAFLLRTELDKDAIGAGCCEVERPGSN